MDAPHPSWGETTGPGFVIALKLISCLTGAVNFGSLAFLPCGGGPINPFTVVPPTEEKKKLQLIHDKVFVQLQAKSCRNIKHQIDRICPTRECNGPMVECATYQRVLLFCGGLSSFPLSCSLLLAKNSIISPAVVNPVELRHCHCWRQFNYSDCKNDSLDCCPKKRVPYPVVWSRVFVALLPAANPKWATELEVNKMCPRVLSFRGVTSHFKSVFSPIGKAFCSLWNCQTAAEMSLSLAFFVLFFGRSETTPAR